MSRQGGIVAVGVAVGLLGGLASMTGTDALGGGVDPADRLRATVAKERAESARLHRRHRAEIRRLRAALRRAERRRWTVSTVSASAYGVGFYGNRTGCGSTLTANARIVAHRSMRCGTRVRVSHGGRAVDAVVGDRGPYIGGRTFDLGPGVWRGLGYTSEAAFGVRTVTVAVAR